MLFFPTVDEDFQYFRSQGYSGSLNDMHYKAMGDLTHTGSLTDRIHQFLVSEYSSFYEAMRDLRNSSASFIALRYGVLTKQPAYSLDFINEYYRSAGVKSNLNPAVTHTRSGQATMVDSDGLLKWAPHNLLSYSEDFSNSGWGKINSSVSANATTAPDGTTTADKIIPDTSTNQHRVDKTPTSSAGYQTFSVYVKDAGYGFAWLRIGSAGARFSIADDTISNVSSGVTPLSQDAGNGWRLISISYSASANDTVRINAIPTLPDGAFTGDGTSGIFVWGAHLYRSDLGGMVNNSATGDSYIPTTNSAVYLPRVGHHIYNGSAWVNEGVLHESEARTNLFPYSDMSTGWTAGNVAKSYTGETAPDGSASLHMTETAINGNHWLYRNPSLTASTQTMSVYAKAESRSWILIRLDGSSGSAYAYFNLGAGSIGTVQTGLTAQISDEGNGWYRCSATADSRADASAAVVGLTTGDGVSSYLGVVATGLYLSAAQLEVGSTPSSYIPTSGSTVTRAAETLTVPSANMPWPTPVEVTGTELVTNGTFDSDVSGWTPTGTGSLAWVSGELQLTSAAGYDQARQAMSGFTVGKTYRVTVSIGASSSNTYVQIVGVAAGSFLGSSARDVTFVFVASATTHTIALINTGAEAVLYDNISVKEINPLSVSIQMDGKVTYADDNGNNTVLPWRWRLDSSNILYNTIATTGTRTGQPRFIQQQATSGYDAVFGANNVYSPNINVPFNFAGRYGSTFINGAHEGTLLTANTTPTALPDLSSTNLELGYIFMGTIGKFRVWSDDLTDTGIATASAPSTEPSLQLTFDGSSTSSFTVLDWSE